MKERLLNFRHNTTEVNKLFVNMPNTIVTRKKGNGCSESKSSLALCTAETITSNGTLNSGKMYISFGYTKYTYFYARWIGLWIV